MCPLCGCGYQEGHALEEEVRGCELSSGVKRSWNSHREQ